MSGYLDTRDLIEERNKLQKEQAALMADIYDAQRNNREDADAVKGARARYEDWDSQYSERLNALDDLIRKIGDVAQYGVTLIPESEFVDYVQELLVDIGVLPDGAPWYVVIDWQETANNVRQDYREVEFEDETYLYRS